MDLHVATPQSALPGRQRCRCGPDPQCTFCGCCNPGPGLAYQLASTVLFFLAILQFAFALVGDTPNARLRTFGVSLGRYLGHVVAFESFATEDLPFPFADWPPGN